MEEFEKGKDGCPASGVIVTVPNYEDIGARVIELLKDVTDFDYDGDMVVTLADCPKASSAVAEGKFGYHRFQVPFGRSHEIIQKALSQIDESTWARGMPIAVEPDHDLTLDTSIGTNFTFGGQHPAYLVGFGEPAARAVGQHGAGRRIVFIDTGYDGALQVDCWDVTGGQAGKMANPIDADGHGTAMVTIAHSLAPNAEYAAVRLAGHGHRITIWGLIAALKVAKHECEGDIISMSLGFDSLSACSFCGGTGAQRAFALETAIIAVAEHEGVNTKRKPVLLASTGNGWHRDRIKYPSAFDSVVTISSIDSAGQHSDFSNYDRSATRQQHHFCAYGGQTDAAKQPTEIVGHSAAGDCYGTSPATAYAAGMMALLWPYVGTDERDDFLDQVRQHHALSLGPPLTHGDGLICFDPGLHPLASQHSVRIGSRRIDLP